MQGLGRVVGKCFLPICPELFEFGSGGSTAICHGFRELLRVEALRGMVDRGEAAVKSWLKAVVREEGAYLSYC